ncbi:MAG: MAPEG family protein [Polymorphobacter sp.]
MSAAPLAPMVAMVFLTFAVWCMLFIRRIPKVKSDPVPLDAMRIRATRPILSEQEMAANDNLMNLFELPVLFYALCLALAVTGFSGAFLTIGCWGYVALRAVHSVVHCTFNNVLLRFAAYLASTLLLFALWVQFALRLAA